MREENIEAEIDENVSATGVGDASGVGELDAVGVGKESVDAASDEGANGASDERPSDTSAEEQRAAQEVAENNALAAVFDDARDRSAKSQLSTPDQWAELGIVPDHMSAEDFEMFVYDYLEAYTKEHKQEVAKQKAEATKKASSFHSARTAVGIPAFMRNKEPEPQVESEVETAPEPQVAPKPQVADSDATSAAASTDENAAAEAEPLFVSAQPERLQHAKNTVKIDDPNNPYYGLEIPAGYKMELIEDEWTLVEDAEAEPVRRELDPRGIVTLVGQHSYYLYDEEQMTSTYAQWAFLAAEDDQLMTFVNCVREEGRTYPRPLAASDLENPPFRMSATKVAETWHQVQESGKYPDIVQVKASNGDVYYASTLYLTAEYAESLAEWSSVGRAMNV